MAHKVFYIFSREYKRGPVVGVSDCALAVQQSTVSFMGDVCVECHSEIVSTSAPSPDVHRAGSQDEDVRVRRDVVNLRDGHPRTDRGEGSARVTIGCHLMCCAVTVLQLSWSHRSARHSLWL